MFLNCGQCCHWIIKPDKEPCRSCTSAEEGKTGKGFELDDEQEIEDKKQEGEVK